MSSTGYGASVAPVRGGVMPCRMDWIWMALLAGLAVPAPTPAAVSTGAAPELVPVRVAVTAADPVAGVVPVGVTRGLEPAPDAGPPEAAGWVWPLAPRPAVVRPFDPPARRWLAGHRGIDLGTTPGAAVLAPADGVVTFAGRVAGRPVVSLRHEGGLRSTYEPVVGALGVGGVVRAGDVVGYVSTEPGHCAPAVCLHWGALRGTTYVDPLSLLGRPPIILLPVP